MSGATLQNNQVNAAGMGSAIQISGSADLEMNYGTITGNTAVDRGAVNFDSTGKFMIQNRISIEGNTLSSGEKANVYLSKENVYDGGGGLRYLGDRRHDCPVTGGIGRGRLYAGRTGSKRSGTAWRECGRYIAEPICR